MFHVPEEFRVTKGPIATTKDYGNEGVFMFRVIKSGPIKNEVTFICIVSCGMGWEHVSVRAQQLGKSRIPYWEEMCQVKDTFWDPEDCVMQLHPAKEDYVNNHPDVLHLWRPIGIDIPVPPPILVGLPKVTFKQ